VTPWKTAARRGVNFGEEFEAEFRRFDVLLEWIKLQIKSFLRLRSM